jgi:hypothetical protein
MKAITREIHGLRRAGVIKAGKNILNHIQQVAANPAAVVAFIKTFQAAVFEAPNHQDTT